MVLGNRNPEVACLLCLFAYHYPEYSSNLEQVQKSSDVYAMVTNLKDVKFSDKFDFVVIRRLTYQKCDFNFCSY